jgi:hypothetical protein
MVCVPSDSTPLRTRREIPFVALKAYFMFPGEHHPQELDCRSSQPLIILALLMSSEARN